MKKLLFIAMLLLATQLVTGQSSTEQQLKDHVYFLADDKLEGRATGSEGEHLASNYIAEQFASIGLVPAGGGGYLEAFDVTDGKKEGENNFISFGNQTFKSPSVYPVTFSATASFQSEYIFAGFGISATELSYDDYSDKDVKGKIVILKLSTPEGNNPHSKFADYADLRTKVLVAVLKGAKGVIFYSADPEDELPLHSYTHNSPRESIPVLFAEKNIIEQLSNTQNNTIQISAELTDIIKTGHNVIGYLDRGASNTIVIGAHYDHLGHGEIDGSLYRGDPAIHNGADDNASGVALIIELAEKLKGSDFKNNNYLFLAFSGEEMGLFGSKAFVNSTLIKNYEVNYMLNFDMVGRLDTSMMLIINGTGTSPEWNVLKHIQYGNLKINTSEGGIGPSDQTSFYLKDIPVLHFFTGSHQDYHKPTDDADKLNYSGIETILGFTYTLIDSLNSKGKIPFVKTQDADSEDTPKFKVTLGVVPDYAYNGKGMRIDGVSDGKPASKAGLLAGDVVIKLGDYDVSEMMSYMKALSKFTKGDTTNVTVLRNGVELIYPITF